MMTKTINFLQIIIIFPLLLYTFTHMHMFILHTIQPRYFTVWIPLPFAHDSNGGKEHHYNDENHNQKNNEFLTQKHVFTPSLDCIWAKIVPSGSLLGIIQIWTKKQCTFPRQSLPEFEQCFALLGQMGCLIYMTLSLRTAGTYIADISNLGLFENKTWLVPTLHNNLRNN